MKVLQVVNFRWYNAQAHYGYVLSCALARLGVEVHLLSHPDSPLFSMARSECHGVRLIPFRFTGKGLFGYVGTSGFLRELLAEERYDIVNVHRGEEHTLFSLLRKLIGRFSLIRTIGDRRRSRKSIFSRHQLQRLTDGVICVSRSLLDDISIAAVPADKLEYIPLGIDTALFTPRKGGNLRARLGIADDEIVVTIIARFSPVKGHDIFIQMARLLSRRFSNVHFLIVGYPAQISEDEITAMVKEAGIEDRTDVIVGSRRVFDLLSVTDVGLIPSTGSEYIARTLLEYIASGVPVVTSNVGVLPDIVTDDFGIVVDDITPTAFACAVSSIISSGRIQQMGRSARKVAERKYSIEKFARDTVDFYEKILERKSSK